MRKSWIPPPPFFDSLTRRMLISIKNQQNKKWRKQQLGTDYSWKPYLRPIHYLFYSDFNNIIYEFSLETKTRNFINNKNDVNIEYIIYKLINILNTNFLVRNMFLISNKTQVSSFSKRISVVQLVFIARRTLLLNQNI